MKAPINYLLTSLIIFMQANPAVRSAEARSVDKPTQAFPFVLPREKPDRPLSAAMKRSYEAYMAPRPEHNELYSQFKYTKLEGFDYNDGDGTISRRDPSKIILENGRYYVWYTKRHTAISPKGRRGYTDTIPSQDWDLADVWYATSKNGFKWNEEGVAIPKPPKPHPGWRAVCTPGILKWEGKFYLYYQAFLEPSGKRGDDCPIAVSVADSPDGPWTPVNKIILPTGAKGEWDQYAVQDPNPLVHDGKIYMYYKSDSDGDPHLVRMQGLAIADHPLGPFRKHPLNPVLNSGHEIALFPFKKGVAVLIIRDGSEHFTIQYAEDWVNFEIASITELMPTGAGFFVPDAFTDTQYGRGVTWGLAHFKNAAGTWARNHCVLTRFDCDLSLDVHYPEMKKHSYLEMYRPEHYYRHGLPKQLRLKIEAMNRKQLEKATPKKQPFRSSEKSDSARNWILDERFSDEFDGRAVDQEKWDKDLRPWGERAWSPDNVFLRDGKLVIRTRYAPHQGRREAYFYKLGILRSRRKTTYGFFEARIKGCSRFPGLCPGFWLYSYGKERNPQFPKVTYSEIDIVEMLQGLYHPALKRRVDARHLDLNLHARVLDEDGKEQWIRPNNAPEICRGFWSAPWDPRDDYHIYACENSPEKIVWYIDGVKVSEKKNHYWHLPMSVTLTMELRPPFIAWAGEAKRVPVPDAATQEGFPTEMEVDYVRCWTVKR